MNERAKAGFGVFFGTLMGYQFFGSIGALAIGGGWQTFLIFGGLCMGIIWFGALCVVAGAFLLDYRDARRIQ